MQSDIKTLWNTNKGSFNPNEDNYQSTEKGDRWSSFEFKRVYRDYYTCEKKNEKWGKEGN